MSTKFYTLLTDAGAEKLAAVAAQGDQLKLTHMAVGDGNGTLPVPNAQQTALVAEKYRAELTMLHVDPLNVRQIIATHVIPVTSGGWWIREIGLFDDAGVLIAIGNCPESYKPQLAEGSAREQTVQMVLAPSSIDAITLSIDPSVVLASREYVDNLIETRQPTSATLSALADLNMAKGKLPYFAEEEAAALADLSDFIRLMLGKSNALSVLEYLGFKSMSQYQAIGAGQHLFQHGSGATNSSGVVDIVFPKAFTTTENLNVLAVATSGTPSNYIVTIGPPTLTGVRIYITGANAGNVPTAMAIGFNWFAAGR